MSLARQVVEAARAAEVQITTAESCTGGMLAAALTDIAGASAVFDRGFITYSYASKPEILGVNPETVKAHGAVSAEVVSQMASGALAHSDADIAIAVTGIAGPVEGSDKPEGRVWFATATPKRIEIEMQDFGPLGRANVRQAAVDYALSLLLKVLTLPKS